MRFDFSAAFSSAAATSAAQDSRSSNPVTERTVTRSMVRLPGGACLPPRDLGSSQRLDDKAAPGPPQGAGGETLSRRPRTGAYGRRLKRKGLLRQHLGAAFAADPGEGGDDLDGFG